MYQNIRDFRAGVFFQAWQQRLEQTGGTVWAWLVGSRILVTSDPENIKAILTASFDDFERGPHMRAAFARLADGIFAADGEHWRTSRALLRPSFAKNEVSDTRRFEIHFRNFFNVLPTDGTLVDLQPLLDRLTMDTATDLLFGASTSSLTLESKESAEIFHQAVKVSLRAHFRDVALGLLGRMLPDRTYFKARQHIRKTVDQYVHNALETNRKEALRDAAALKAGKPKRYVFLDHVVERAKDPEVLRDQSISLLMGGTETTASLLGNLLYVLARRPEIWDKLRAGGPGIHREHDESGQRERRHLLIILFERESVSMFSQYFRMASADARNCSAASLSSSTGHCPLQRQRYCTDVKISLGKTQIPLGRSGGQHSSLDGVLHRLVEDLIYASDVSSFGVRCC